jgi:TonB family protein
MGTGTTGADSTGQEAAATDATTDTQTTAAALAQPKKARIAAAETPEETIGVSRAGAQTTRSNEVVVNGRRPVWRYTPRPERLAEYYPADALERGREGEASLHCMVQKKGVLDCTRVSETPARAGFGVAALRVARTFRHAEQRADGRNAIGTPINLHVVFRMADGERRG